MTVLTGLEREKQAIGYLQYILAVVNHYFHKNITTNF